MSTSSRIPSHSISSTSRSPSLRMGSQELVTDLSTSSNHVAAGIGEVLQALIAATSGGPVVTMPIMIECGDRVMALGRKRMAAMTGRNAFLYLKSKFGLLSSSTALYLQASFIGSGQTYVEVDLDAWEELVPQIEKLRIIG